MLGIPATFLKEACTAWSPIRSAPRMCLILVGLFFAAPLYRMNLLTIGDFYRKRFGRSGRSADHAVHRASPTSAGSAAQITALGLVFNVVSDGAITQQPA